MPKAEPHFDAAGLCEEALSTDYGLIVSTNNVAGFRRVLYKHMRQQPAHKLQLFADPRSPDRLFLLKPGVSPDGQES